MGFDAQRWFDLSFDVLGDDSPSGPLVSIDSVFPIAIAGVLCAAVRERQALVLSEELADAARRAGWKLAVSFERVEHLSSACLNMLVELHLRCRHKGGSLVVFGLPDEVDKIIRVTRLDSKIPVAVDAHHARELLSAPAIRSLAA